MDLLIHPNYLPSTSQFLLMFNSKKVIFEINDNFLKQTYRNRTYIYGANGKLLLSIPVIHSQKNRKKASSCMRFQVISSVDLANFDHMKF